MGFSKAGTSFRAGVDYKCVSKKNLLFSTIEYVSCELYTFLLLKF